MNQDTSVVKNDSTNLSNEFIKFIESLFPNPRPLTGEVDLISILQGIAVVVFIGLLIGLEREYSRKKTEKIFAGIRTFPLIGLYGFTSAMISSITVQWIYAVFFLGYSILSTASYYSAAIRGRRGGTSEIAGFLVFILGSMVFWGYMHLPVIIAIIITLFLSLKIQLHSFVGKINSEDIYATLKLAIITLIILPILPNRYIGPMNVINPIQVWYMVIFVSGLSFLGYILMKLYGSKKGILFTSLLGGLVSSTAYTFSISKKSKLEENLSFNYGLGIIAASSMMFIRALIIISILNSNFAKFILVPFLIFFMIGFFIYLIFYKNNYQTSDDSLIIKNPFELKSAFMFGLVFGLTIFITKLAQVYFGNQGVYVASSLAGFSSIDAIIISLSKFFNESISSIDASRSIVFATSTNTLVKIIISNIWGSSQLKKIVTKGLGFVFISQIIYLIILFL
ncbi:MAG: MgtC/SapB family protein [Ignavibacterium sp.]|nr:MgtC/SapB family protein [Ignavibacterium sp.]